MNIKEKSNLLCFIILFLFRLIINSAKLNSFLTLQSIYMFLFRMNINKLYFEKNNLI